MGDGESVSRAAIFPMVAPTSLGLFFIQLLRFSFC
jgi:hypothetical protein